MSSRNNSDRKREVEDLSAKRYARKPMSTAMFAFILTFSGIIILSVLPLSFFFDPGSFSSKIRIGDFPLGMIIPPQQQSPNLDITQLPDWLQDLLLDYLNNTDTTNITIPQISPDIPPINYIGNGPLGPNVLILTTPEAPSRHWRLMTYDNFDGTNWSQTNTTTDPYNFGTTYTGADIYQVRINLTLPERYGFGLPLLNLWDTPEILNTPPFSVTVDPNLTWNMIKNEYNNVFLNISNNGLTPIDVQIQYNVTYNPNVNSTYIMSNVDPNPPSNGPSLPGKYLQTPSIPSINSYLQDFLSKMNPISTTNDTYNTTIAALEYFKTRFFYKPTANQDITGFFINGSGNSNDFATAFALFLRHLNISTRYVMGSIGYFSVIPPWLPLTNTYYWTEVWIPDNSGGGNWVQFDPTPVPYRMYMYYQNVFIPMNTRINDNRMETDHFDLILSANVTPLAHQNRNTDIFEFTAQLLKNYQPVNGTILEPIIKINFSDSTNDTYLGEVQVDTNNESKLTTHFFDDSTVGPHKFNASWLAVSNTTSTVITCNGTTKAFINYINGIPSSSFTNISVIRGPNIAFTVIGNLTDNLNGKPVDGQLVQIVVNESNTVIGSGYTNESGEFQIDLNVSSNVHYGVYHFFAMFNGSFIANYSEPYPDIPVGHVIGSESNSSQYEIIIFANTSLTKNFNPSQVFVGENFTVYGTLLFDNLTGFPGQVVNVYETNSSGEFFVGTNTTTAGGAYSVTFLIPADHEAGVNVLFKVNTSISDPYVLNATVNPDPPAVIPVNFAIYQVSPIDPVRGITNVFISGRVVRKDGSANLSNEQISILFNNSPINVFTTTNQTGYFNSTFKVPNSINTGNYIVNATTTNSSYDVWNDDVNWNNITVQPIWVNFSISKVNPLVVIKTLTDITIKGRVVQKNQLFNISNEQISILINNVPLNIFTTTNQTGHFETVFRMPSAVPAGIYTINATTTNTSYGIIKDNTSWQITVEDLWLNYSITQVSPIVAIKTITDINIYGRVFHKDESFNVSFEQLQIYLNNSPINIFTTTNGSGYFNTTFKIPNSITPGNYILNVTSTNTSYTTLQDNTTWMIRVDPIWVNITISQVTPAEVSRGVTSITLTGWVVHKDNAFNISNEQISILLDNTPINVFVNTDGTGNFTANFVIPNTFPVGSYIINATTTNANYIVFKDDITKIITVNSTSSFSQIGLNYQSFRVGEFVVISGYIYDSLGQVIPGYMNNLSIYFNSTLLPRNSFSGANGYFLINCTIPATQAGAHIINITYNGSGLFLSTSIVQNVNVFTTPQVQLSTPTPFAIIGSVMIVAVKAYDANTKLGIMGRMVDLRLFNVSIAQLFTNSKGEIYYLLPAFDGIFSFQAFFEGNSTDISNQITIFGYSPPPDYNWVWILIIIAAVTVVSIVFGNMYYKKLQIKKYLESIKIRNVKDKLKSLIDGQKYREAIVLLYQIYRSKLLELIRKPPLPGLTFRELMTTLVKKIKFEPDLVYPFTSNYEEARFSDHDITLAFYNKTYKLFEKLMRKSFELEEIVIEEEEKEEIIESEISPIVDNIEI
ncbi:MAG: transglutaminase domain-containing protein [Candidatus Helarchaeota archaeon]